MESRPKIKLVLTKWDKVLESVCITLLMILWITILASYAQLPDTIPIHYNALGKADGYGNKTSILFLPIVATTIYIGMTLLNKYPHIYNYGTSVTLKNAKTLYTSATRLFRIIKLGVVLIFTAIVFMTIKISTGVYSGLGSWFLSALITLLIVPNIYYIMKTTNSELTRREH